MLVFCHKNICFITLLLLRLFTFLVLRNVICIFIDHLNNESIKNDEKNMFLRIQKSFTMTKYLNFVHFRKFMMWFLFVEFYNPFIYFTLPFFCKIFWVISPVASLAHHSFSGEKRFLNHWSPQLLRSISHVDKICKIFLMGWIVFKNEFPQDLRWFTGTNDE